MEYIFRVLIDSDDEDSGAFRDIAINSSTTFNLLHEAIIGAFNFRGDQMASFYLSDEDWNKGDEIGLMDMSGDGSNFKLMGETTIKDLVTEKGQKLLYVYDFLNMWCFFVELVEINELNNEKNYPTLERILGTAPSEDSKNIMADLNILTNFEEEEEEDDYGFGDFDDSVEFQNIDDLDL